MVAAKVLHMHKIMHNKKGGRKSVTPVVAVVTAESPACKINSASCYMPAHMASLSECEILIGSSFSIARGLNGHAKANFEMFQRLSIFYF